MRVNDGKAFQKAYSIFFLSSQKLLSVSIIESVGALANALINGRKKPSFVIWLPRMSPLFDIGASVSLQYPLCAKLKLIIPTVSGMSSNFRCPCMARFTKYQSPPTCHDSALKVTLFIREKPKHSRQLLLMPHFPLHKTRLQLTCKERETEERKTSDKIRIQFDSVR